ncbi:hypothetical protein Hanom_Chr07g00611411 [Helianthus anomalus]
MAVALFHLDLSLISIIRRKRGVRSSDYQIEERGSPSSVTGLSERREGFGVGNNMVVGYGFFEEMRPAFFLRNEDRL